MHVIILKVMNQTKLIQNDNSVIYIRPESVNNCCPYVVHYNLTLLHMLGIA